MEKAIFITKASQLKYVNDKYTRLYFGNEFCEKLIPSLKDLKEVASFVRKKGLNFSLVTPYVTNVGLKRLSLSLELLTGLGISCEVIINDWGTLNLINHRYPNLKPVLGRLLTKQKRGPRLIRLLKRKTRSQFIKDLRNPKIKHLVFQKKLPLNLDSYYKGSNTSSVPIIHNFLISQRIQRIELDNTAQGLFLELPRESISASVYLPYVYISTTFFCLTAGCDQKKRSLLKHKPCKKQCQRYVFKLRHRTMPKVIYLKGNTQFYKNAYLSIKNLENSGIDRIVYEPKIPI
jgi:hypothetical protein